MHVLVLTSEFPPRVLGGLGTVAYEHTRRLAAFPGVRVTVAAPGGGRRPRWTSGGARRARWRVLWVPRRRPYALPGGFHPGMLARLLRVRRLPRPDVVYVHSPDVEAAALWFRRRRVPVAYFCHSVVAHEGGQSRRRRRQARLLRAADAVLVPSAAARRVLRAYHPYCAGKTRVVPHGVPFPRRASRRRSRSRLLFAGRLHGGKGYETLLHALARVARRHRRVHLEVCGTASASRRRRLHRMARRLGIASRIRHRGWVSPRALARSYRRAAAVVVPSRWESFGLVALEGLAHGTPLVCSNAGALRHIPHAVAYKVPPGNPRALAGAIRRVLSRPAEARARARRGRAWARRFTWRRSAVRVLAVLRRLARGRRP